MLAHALPNFIINYLCQLPYFVLMFRKINSTRLVTFLADYLLVLYYIYATVY